MSFEQTISNETTLDRNAILRERILSQDAELMHAANALANKIRSVPPDPTCPDTEPQAFLVGGFVRDAILGKHPKDADLEVYGISQERLESLLTQLFGDRVITAGKDFTVYKVNISEGVDLDISMPRRESKSGPTRTDFVVTGDPTMSKEDAARRRDFTINTMMADPLTGEIIDPYHGIDDLDQHILRMVNPQTFIEDEIRVYRALQFVARMNLSVEPETKALLKEMVDLDMLSQLSKDKVTEEIRKLLEKSPRPSVGLELAKELGIIEAYYPELAALERTPQNPKHHPEGNVWNHTMMVVDQAAIIAKDPAFNLNQEERIQLLLGALCHDLGKPETTEEIEGQLHSYKHESVGVEPTKSLLARWSFNKDINASVAMMTINHAVPFQHLYAFQRGDMDEKTFANAARRLIKSIYPCSWKVLIALSISDTLGRKGDDEAHQKEAKELQQLYFDIVKKYGLDIDPKATLIRGDDVVKLGIKQGKEIGVLIKKIEAMRDAGEVTTREEALEALNTLIGKR